MYDKRGLLGKIILVLSILILTLLILMGITAFQVYNLYKTIMHESLIMGENIKLLNEERNCSRFENIDNSIFNLKTEMNSACKNPIISIGSSKIKQLPVSCETKEQFEQNLRTSLEPIKLICSNQTNIIQD